MSYWVVVDIGCIECRESSHVLGVFTDADKAEEIRADAERRQEEHWYGQHHFNTFEIAAIDQPVEVVYK